MSLQIDVTSDARTPLTLVAPEANSSAGPEVVEMGRLCGVKCDPWQEFALDVGLREESDPFGRVTPVASVVVVLANRQNGKGGLLEPLALSSALLRPEFTIGWTAHEFKTVKEASLRVQSLIYRSDDIAKRVTRIVSGNNETSISFNNGSRIVFATRTAGALRGFTIHLLIADEGFALTDDHMAALAPTQSAAGPEAQLWVTSSPPLTGDTGKVLYRLRREALAGRPGIAYLDWGIPGVDLDDLSEVDLDDRRLWRRTNPAHGFRITDRSIAAERINLSDVAFARERLGVWPKEIKDEAERPIDSALWRSCAIADELIERPTDVTFSVVTSYDRKMSCIIAVGERSDGRLQASMVDCRPGVKWLVGRLCQLRDEYDPVTIAIQDKGPTAPLLLDLISKDSGYGFKTPEDLSEPDRGDIAVPWAHEVAMGYAMTIDALKAGTLSHVDDPQMTRSVLLTDTRPLGSGTAWDYKAPTAIQAIGLSLAVWAHRVRMPLVTGSEDPLGVW